MPPSTIAARSIVLAALGLAASGAAFAQVPPAANVAAFNPYTSGGWGSGAGQPRAYPATLPAAPAAPTVAGGGGPGTSVGAFNPWRAQTQAPATISPYGTYIDNEPGANLPAPPPGPIRSRLLAVPQRGEGVATRAAAPVNSATLNNATRPQPVTVAARAPTQASAPLPMAVAPAPRAPAQVAAAPAVVAAIPAPVAPVAQAPAAAPPAAAPAPRPAAVASIAPPPPAPEAAPASPPRNSSGGTTVIFAGQSAELTDAARAALDSLAQTLASKNTRQIELRAYAGGTGPESRKVSLARALAVRSYLIDRGVKSRIDVGAFLAETPGGANERVDVVAPNT